MVGGNFGQATVVGMPCYRRNDYARILEIMVDREKLAPTFDKWQSRAEKMESQILGSGKSVHRVVIDPDLFPAWCAGQGLNVDANARMKFAADPRNWAVGQKH